MLKPSLTLIPFGAGPIAPSTPLKVRRLDAAPVGLNAPKQTLRVSQTGGSATRKRPLRGRVAAVLTAFFALLVFLPATAQASFGISSFNVTATEENGEPDLQAGSHPYALTTTVNFNLAPGSGAEPGGPFSDGDVRDIHLELPPGLIENPAAVPQCSLLAFNTPRTSPFQKSLSGESCPDKTQIGVIALHTPYAGGATRTFGVFNLTPPPGAPSQLGAAPFGVPITFTPRVREAGGEYGLTLDSRNISQPLDILGFELTLWGAPWSSAHDNERGNCLNEAEPAAHFGEPAHGSGEEFVPGTCSIFTAGQPPAPPRQLPPQAYLSLPSACGEPIRYGISADSWQQPALIGATPAGGGTLVNCLPLSTIATAQPSTGRTSTATGLDFNLDVDQGGLLDPSGRVPSPVRTAVFSLPEGMTINPSLGAGLGVCTPASYAAETVSSPPGAGCPNSSKIGTATVQSPLFEGPLAGSLFLAEPDDPTTAAPGAENPFDSLIALYVVAKSTQLGVMVKLAGKVEANPQTGRLVTTFEGLPQLPYSHFNVHFRDGQRSPLVSPPTCGGYLAPIEITPWIDPNVHLRAVSSFFLTKGIGGGPCPSAQTPFEPQAEAGTLNSQAGAYSPFYLHLTRSDGEQEITSYSTVLPPGLLGKIAGIPFCPDADIEAAKRRRGFEEAEHPSCPVASEIGHTTTGYGLGGVLAYAPGKLYLAGPYHGRPLSIVAIDPALVGPFDLGVIVIRSALHVDPETAQVSIDPDASDPIPHIREGIPLHLRDIRVYISRPQFTVNPTNCEPLQVTSGLIGSSPPFTNPVGTSASVSNLFQVSDCSALGFEPKLSLKLLGATKRNDYPKLRAELREPPGDANVAKAEVVLPRTEFLAQEHIRTVCTQKQFAAESCPAGSVYGSARAYSPLLSEPLQGPVLLRSGKHTLPDMVVALKGDGGIAINLSARIDQLHGGMRASFESLPDGTADKFVLTLFGGKRGLLVNSANVCRAPAQAGVDFIAQDGAGYAPKVMLDNQCQGQRHKSSHAAKKGS